MATHPAHLDPSKLGTKEYWDALYATELSNHAANPSDTGTVWFDDSDAEAKLLSFLSSRASPSLCRKTTSFLDLGCGNGNLLLSLRARGWHGPMLGVDYSAQSVALARRIAAHPPAASDPDDSDGEQQQGEKEEEPYQPPRFLEWDAVAGPYAAVLSGPQSRGWDVVLDKGTFDAISLSDEQDAQTGRRICETYCRRALRLVRPGGLFLVTSCNWTETELQAWFGGDQVAKEDYGVAGQKNEEVADAAAAAGARFVMDGRVEYRSFSFGGAKGQTISSLCFRRERTGT